MSDYHFRLVMGATMPESILFKAAELLSQSYTKWQRDPRNVAPIDADTSPGAYARTMRESGGEVALYFERDQLCGAFLHSLSPNYDQYPLRKLSFLAVKPLERGFEALKTVFRRYGQLMAEQAEDVIATSDLDQATLNVLLAEAGFREAADRNETYYLLSQLLLRKVFKAQRVADDFVVDEIITCDGKTFRRNKTVMLLQTSGENYYQTYRRQQRKRIERSIPEANRERLRQALAHADDGVFFVSDFVGSITLRGRGKGGFDSFRALTGGVDYADRDRLVIPDKQLLYLAPRDEDALKAMADQTVLRPGFFDFLTFTQQVLGSFFVVTGAPRAEAEHVLARHLHPKIALRYLDLVERLFCPVAEPVTTPCPPCPLQDGVDRTPWRYSGPYIEVGPAGFVIRKDHMARDILRLKGASAAPVVCLGNDQRFPGDTGEDLAVREFFATAAERRQPVLIFDFGQGLTRWINRELLRGEPDKHPWCSVVGVRDFYQIPVMLELLGLAVERDDDLRLLPPRTG